MTWWWLSFADKARPPGRRFLGGCVVGPAADFPDAVVLAHVVGCNPGGEVLGEPIVDELEPKIPTRYRNRLLTRAEAEQFDREMLALRHSN